MIITVNHLIGRWVELDLFKIKIFGASNFLCGSNLKFYTFEIKSIAK